MLNNILTVLGLIFILACAYRQHQLDVEKATKEHKEKIEYYNPNKSTHKYVTVQAYTRRVA